MPESRHYPSLVQLGNYDELFPVLTGKSNYHIILDIYGLALDRADDDAIDLYQEIFPTTATASGLLPEWERFVGIKPDDLVALENRRNAVVARLRARGGLSHKYFKTLAEGLGYNYGLAATQPRIWFVEGNDYVPFRADISASGDQVWNPAPDAHDHLVTINGTDVESDAGLISLFNKHHPVGITFLYRSE